ncbi:MAG: tetratricopeptide repeat protein [Terriglobia bacterium]
MVKSSIPTSLWIALTLMLLALASIAAFKMILSQKESQSDQRVSNETGKNRLFWDTYRQASNKRAAGELDEAIGLYQRVLEIRPTHEDSIYYQGNCYLQLGRYQEALDSYARLIEINPQGSSRGYMQMGLIYGSLGPGAPADLKKAGQIFEKTLSVDPDSGALLALGEIALLEGNWEKARQRLQSANADNPMSMAAPYLLGYLCYRKGEREQAWNWFKTAVQRGELKKPALKWTEEGDVKADPELRWRALARQSIFGDYWLPIRKYLKDPTFSIAAMDSEYNRLAKVLATHHPVSP